MTTLKDVMKNVDFLIDSENMLELKSFLLLAKQTQGTEFEVRFQNLSQINFEQVKNYIEIDKYFTSKKDTKSVSEILFNDIRIEKFGEPNTKEYKEVYQSKREIKNMKLSLNNIPIKFNLSRENIIEPSSIKDKRPKLTRTKYRTSYTFDQYYIDFTYVESIDNNNRKSISFEVEIEFKTNKNIDEQSVIVPIKYILKLLKPDRFSFMDELSEQSIRRDYITLISFSNNSRPDYIYENKPINFKLENIDTFNHSITNKLNGINFFLFYDNNKNNFYLINHSTVEYLGKDTTNKLKGKFLIQGELYHDKSTNKYIYYIFDTLIIGSEKVIDDFHKTRLDKFYPYFNIIDESLFYTNKGIRIQYKTFYGLNGIDPNNPNDNNYNNLIQCLHSLSKDKNGNIDMETNDGFIFTPLDKRYINKETYKYKFPETMTIDFSVTYKETKNNYNVYNIFTYNEKKQLIPFMSSKFVMICDNNSYLCKQIRNNFVVECFFDKNQQVFIPYRIRYDKTLPNFYTVANNVFSDIMKPITLKELEDVFKNKFSKVISHPNIQSPVSRSPIFQHNITVETKQLTSKDSDIFEEGSDLSDKPSSKKISPKSQQILEHIPMSPRHKSPLKHISSPSFEESYIESIHEDVVKKTMSSPRGRHTIEDHKNLEDILNLELQENIKKMKEALKSELIPKTPEGTPPRYIEIENVTLAVKLDTVFECVLFSVSPEYRILIQKDEFKRDLMFKTALQHFNNDKEKIRDLDYLAETFNIQIYILNKEGDEQDIGERYRLIDKTETGIKNNKLYILDTQNYYKVLGYTKNGYDVFIY